MSDLQAELREKFTYCFPFLPHSDARVRLATSDLSCEMIDGKKRAANHLTLLAFWLMSALVGCSKPADQPVIAVPAADTLKEAGGNPVVNACSLLTSQEIETVLGAPLRDTKPSTNTSGDTTSSQCYFLLPVAADSVVLTVTQTTGVTNSPALKESWERLFHGDREADHEREKEESNAPSPEKIVGLGDEAFWAPRRFGGALYALKGPRYITITVGSAGDQETKLKKLKALAEIALSRL